MEYEFVETQKGGRALLTKGYRYLRIRAGKEGNEFWRCSYRACLAEATTSDGCLVSLKGEHNHAPNPSKNKAEKVIAKMRKRTREEVSIVPAIYNDEVQAVAMDED